MSATELGAAGNDSAGENADAGASGREIIGQVYRLPTTYEVSREKVREFAKAVLDTHPAHATQDAASDLGHERIIASPTFVAILAPFTQKYLFDNVLVDFDLSQVLQADQRFDYARPLAVGDVLSVDVVVEGIREMAGSSMFTIRNDFRGADGDMIVQSWTTLVGRAGVEVDPDLVAVVQGVTRVDINSEMS